MSLQLSHLFTSDSHLSCFRSSGELNDLNLPFHLGVYIYNQRMSFSLFLLLPFSSPFSVVSRFQLPWRGFPSISDYLVRCFFASGMFFVPLFLCHFRKIFEVFGIRIY